MYVRAKLWDSLDEDRADVLCCANHGDVYQHRTDAILKKL